MPQRSCQRNLSPPLVDPLYFEGLLRGSLKPFSPSYPRLSDLGTIMFMRWLFIFSFCCIAYSASEAQLPSSLDRIRQAHGIPYEDVSLVVREVDGDESVLAHFPDVPRNPASTIKLLTTWVALEVLGPTYSWPTEIYFLGDWDGRQLNGDLAIKGYGDPYLVTEEFWKLLGALRRIGLEEINGDLIIDDSFFGDVTESPGDFDGQPYRAYNVSPNALLINFKAVRFQFLTDPNDRDVIITLDPLPENLNVVNQLSLTDGPCRGYQAGISFDVRDPETAKMVVFSGFFPKACSPYYLSRTVLEHDTFVFGVFSTLWRELGGQHHGGLSRGVVSDEIRPVLTWQSRPLAEVIRSINKYSNNVMTRQLLYTLGAENSTAPGTREDGVEVIRSYLVDRGLSPESLVIDNGAGLSRETRISAALLAEVLQLAEGGPYGAEFVASMSIGGLDGTTRGRFSNQEEGRAHIKTGRLDHVTALAGYVHAASGKTYVVTAMVNTPDAHRGPGEELLNELVNWVHALP